MLRALLLSAALLAGLPVFAADFVNSVNSTCVEQDTLGERGFAGINVGTDANISDFCDLFFHFS